MASVEQSQTVATPGQPPSFYKADTIDVFVVVQLLWSRKYFIALVAFVFALAAALWAITATPVYRAEVVVVPTPESGASDSMSLGSRLGGLASLAGVDLGNGSGAVSTALPVLRSRRLIEEFFRRKGLISELYATAKTPPTLWSAVDRFRQANVSIASEKERGTTTVAVNWTDPTLAATWANELVALANDLIRGQAREDSSRNIEYLNGQLEQTNVVELRRALYSLIEAETQRAMLANARVEYAFTVVDPAVAPESRISPKRTLMVLTGGVVGLFVAVAGVLLHSAIRRARVAAPGSPRM